MITLAQTEITNTSNNFINKLTLEIMSKPSILEGLTLHERIDNDILDKLINSNLLKETFHNDICNKLYSNEKEQLIKYKKNIRGGFAVVKYNKAKNNLFGRANPDKALGLFNIRRELRQTIAKQTYIDIDIENCHPVMLLQVMEQNHIKSDILKSYVDNRADWFNLITTAYSCSREQAKTLMIIYLYGGGFDSWKEKQQLNPAFEELPDLNAFKQEVRGFQHIITNHNPHISKIAKKIKNDSNITSFNLEGTTCAYFLQEYERRVLETLYKYCLENSLIINRSCVLCADGIMLEKNVIDNVDELITHFNKIIKEEVGFDLNFVEKQMNQDYLDILDSSILPEKKKLTTKDGAETDLDACNIIVELHPYWVTCLSVLYVFNDDTGMWTDDENIIFHIFKKHEDKLHQLVRDVFGNLRKISKGYGNTTKLMKQLLPLLKTININDEWLNVKRQSSLGKLLFMNGYLNMRNGKFYNEFDPDIVFFNRINHNFEGFDDEAMEYMSDIENRFFLQPLGSAVGDYFILNIARALAGDLMKRILFGLGDTDCGKSIITLMLQSALGDYCGSFNAENLAFSKSSADEASIMRWAYLLRYKRIICSNEVKSSVLLNGNIIKKVSSGGDALIGREHFKAETNFIPHFLAIIMSNDMNKITPYDSAVRNRIKIIPFSKQFVENPTNENELKKDENVKSEIDTLRFKQVFVGLLIKRYIQFIRDENSLETVPVDVIQGIEDWVGGDEDTNLVNIFKNEFNITNDESDYVTSKDIEDWLKEQSSGISMKKFAIEFKKYCNKNNYDKIKVKQKKIHGKNINVWVGIKEPNYDEEE